MEESEELTKDTELDDCNEEQESIELVSRFSIMEESEELTKDTELDECNEEQESIEVAEQSEPSAPKWKPNFELINLEASNALLYRLYIQGDYVGCKSLIGEMLEQCSNQSEYAFYMRGVIARAEGELEEALTWFNKALAISPSSTTLVPLVSRLPSKSYYWLARAIYHLDTDLFNPCEKARDLLMQLEPENLDVMFKMGMLYLRNNNEDPAFAMFGKALSYDSTHQQVAILPHLLYFISFI
ncbi:unnamed protein product [Strongylus vulgaris]|uniref:Uncharacterized protein n=1 Tax=Strongylus vulgaris TaxID=40348 RepID=A0A3P7IW65_STRVU|nr:unnamed protein product [Strongylus vulgaris]